MNQSPMVIGTILLAEDDENDVELMRILLHKCRVLNPLRVVYAGDQAIRYFQGIGAYANRALYPVPILLLLDIKMPRTDGFEVLRWLQTQPKPDFPTVVVTGAIDSKTMKKAYELGAHTFMVKPIEQHDFLPLVRGFKGIEVEPGDPGRNRI